MDNFQEYDYIQVLNISLSILICLNLFAKPYNKLKKYTSTNLNKIYNIFETSW